MSDRVMKITRRSRSLAGVTCAAMLSATAVGEDHTVDVFASEEIRWIDGQPELEDRDGFVVRFAGHTVERTLDLPPEPAMPLQAYRIIAQVRVEPIYTDVDGRRRPNDPWTRLGSITIDVPAPGGEGTREAELLRFTTGFGARGVFEQDVTALAPVLHGEQTIRGFISTYSEEPGWTLSLTLRYTTDGVGQRRPVLADHLFLNQHVTRAAPKTTTTVTIPEGLDQPRIRVLSTGHATDGRGGNEFESCAHVLTVDGREIARWRPWTEKGGELRSGNPWAGRRVVDGREIRSSDFDRTGWHPGLIVEPLIIPVPELTAGEHTIEVEILGIRPKGPEIEEGKRPHGYWVLSAWVVADEPWSELQDEP